MRLICPVHAKGISLKSFVAYKGAVNDLERVIAITGSTRERCERLNLEATAAIIENFEVLINGKEFEFSRFIQRKSDDLTAELAFIPDLEALTLREWGDALTIAGLMFPDDEAISEGAVPDYSKLPLLMAILYRPIDERVGKYYTLKPWNPDKIPHLQWMDYLNMDQCFGALGFFLTIQRELERNSLEYLMTMSRNQRKELTNLD